FYGIAPRPHAVGNSNSSKSIAGQGQSGNLLPQSINFLKPPEMAYAVLSHGGFPSINAGKARLSTKSDNLLQFVADGPDQLLIGQGPNLFRNISGEKATK